MIDNKTKVGLTIWDTAGQERYHALNAAYYRNSNGVLIVYDVTDKDSFEKAKKWQTELSKYLPEAPIVIAGNKCDMVNRAVDEDMANQFARSVGADHVLTSAKSGHNVKEVFTSLARSKHLTDLTCNFNVRDLRALKIRQRIGGLEVSEGKSWFA